MVYSLSDITWLFFVYSFAGWCIEVCWAAIQRRHFVNRGFVNGPLCPIYGFGSTLFALFLPELTGNLFFLFLGGGLLAAMLEYLTGLLMEKIFHKKLWDYSHIRHNLGGYICLRYSLLWGVLAVVTMKFSNGLICGLFRLVPRPVALVVQWAAAGLLLTDFLTTAMAVLGMKITARRLAQLTEGIQQTSRVLENTLTNRVRKRMEKSFPSIDQSVIVEDIKNREKTEKPAVFAPGCGFYKLTALFFIGAFLGDITETIFMLITTHTLMSRSSVVYGPFSIVWGLGCALLTLFLYRYRNKSDGYIFMAGTLLGGVYEYICSVFTEMVFGTIFWDYSGFAFNLGGRINLLYCFFWGIAAVVWLKLIYPKLSEWVEKIPKKFGTIFFNCMIVFMIFNMLLSSLVLARYTERHTNDASNPGGQELTALDEFLDSRFDDERVERIYPNAKIVDDGN
ncbi:MAG: putative ABC transporter permease [Lachnospiraceae bacterium]|nr:putative ABC transporter permease [Lachnospiraceae bacterium]